MSPDILYTFSIIKVGLYHLEEKKKFLQTWKQQNEHFFFKLISNDFSFPFFKVNFLLNVDTVILIVPIY